MTHEEFKQQIRQIRPTLVGVARRYLTDEEAEDTVQDVLLRLWQMVGQLHSPLEPLARRLVRNFAIDKLRRKRPMVPLHEINEAQDEVDGEILEHMMRMVEALPDMQQLVLRLRHMDGMEMSEIALLTGSSEVALRQVLSRARRAVLQKMKDNKNKENHG